MALTLFGIIINESVSSSDPNRVRGMVMYCSFYAVGGLLLGGLTTWIHDPNTLFLTYTLMLLAAVIPTFF
jgi:uncharacterized membrane protein